MNGYIKKQALMDYCSNQVTRTIDLNDIARFPIAEIYTKADMVAMLMELNREMDAIKECEYQIFGKESWDFVGKCQDMIQSKIDKLEENEDDTNTD